MPVSSDGRAVAAVRPPFPSVLALCAIGTQGLWRTLTKPCHRSEVRMAAFLLRLSPAEHAAVVGPWFPELRSGAAGGYAPRPPARADQKQPGVRPLRRLRTARSWPSCMRRRGTATATKAVGWCGSSHTRWTIRAGRARAKSTRLLTTLLDARRHPAQRLITLYHDRWKKSWP